MVQLAAGQLQRKLRNIFTLLRLPEIVEAHNIPRQIIMGRGGPLSPFEHVQIDSGMEEASVLTLRHWHAGRKKPKGHLELPAITR